MIIRKLNCSIVYLQKFVHFKIFEDILDLVPI